MRNLRLELFRQVAPPGILQEIDHAATVKLHFRNGANGFFVLPCHRVQLTFALEHPASESVRRFIDARLPDFAERHPSVEFALTPVNGGKAAHARASYGCGPDKLAALHNLKDARQVEDLLLGLLKRSGDRARRFRCEVVSDAPAIRPLWSPFHDNRSNQLHDYVMHMRKERRLRQWRLSLAQRRNLLQLRPGAKCSRDSNEESLSRTNNLGN
jgi:large subunit ribosomal protein L43